MKKILVCSLFALSLPLSAAQVEITSEDVPLPQACSHLEYPSKSVEKGQKGLLIMDFLLAADGKAKEVRIVKSSGFRELDKAGHDALYACKGFQAPAQNEQPVEKRFRIRYDWTL